MAINLSAIRDLLWPGLNAVFGDYQQIPAQWSQVFERRSSDKASERLVEMAYLGLAQLRSEGQATAIDDGMGERFVYNFTNQGVALGFVVTRYAIKDNLYKTEFKPNAEALKRSFQQTKEIICANVLNNAGTYNAATGGDGVSLINTAHPVDGGTSANRPTVDVELNESSLQDMCTTIRYFKDARNLRYLSKATKLILPPQLEYVGERLMKTELRVGTADNDINALKNLNKVSKGYVVMDFLTSAKAWYLQTDADNGLIYFDRESFETDMQVDFLTQNLMVTGYERYQAGAANWRGLAGTFPT